MFYKVKYFRILFPPTDLNPSSWASFRLVILSFNGLINWIMNYWYFCSSCLRGVRLPNTTRMLNQDCCIPKYFWKAVGSLFWTEFCCDSWSAHQNYLRHLSARLYGGRYAGIVLAGYSICDAFFRIFGKSEFPSLKSVLLKKVYK